MKSDKSLEMETSLYKKVDCSLASKEGEKRSRRKSGRFLGLSFKSFSKDSSGKHEDEEKVSILKRFGSRRSSKKKKNKCDKNAVNKAKTSTTSSSSSHDGTDSTMLSDELNSDGPGHTPKMKRLKKVTSDKVQEILNKSTSWESESEGEESCTLNDKMSKRRTSLGVKSTGNRLKRSMSLICGSSRSKLSEVKVSVSRKTRERRSLGAGKLDSVRQQSQVIKGKENDNCDLNLGVDMLNIEEDTDISTPMKSTEMMLLDKLVSSVRRRSMGGLCSSVKKRPKRHSYDRMNRERDGVMSCTKTKPDDQTFSPNHRYALRRKWSSFKLNLSGQKAYSELNSESDNSVPFLSNSNEEKATRLSLRRKSLGGMTPRNRRGSGIYGSTATPTFMTCGFIMTDSPPNTPPELGDSRPKRANSAITRPGTVAIQPLDYNAEDLPWVAMKRKRRSEVSERSQVNRSHAGHTPLPPRKKRKSYDERLIQ